jgi:beta-fructofuranosidase
MDTDTIRDARRLRESYQEDHHRPQFHFVAPEGHCSPFDPNGALYWNGRYHLFYLIGTYEEGQTSWGHASSADLLHWRHHPRALVPDAGEEHMFSGDAFVTRDGTPALVYHSVGHGNCIATAADEDLIEWQKSPANPVMPNPAWDPAAWREDDVYYSLSGSNPEHEPDELTLYRSENLEEWERRHQFVFSPEEWDVGADYSCPDFFPLGDRHVLLFISHDRGAQCLVGRYEDERFYPEDHYRMNWPGGTLFAPESLVDDDGRRIFWAWVPEARTPEAQLESGWSGVMSLPRTLSLDDVGRLLVRPVNELERLRSNHRSDRNFQVGSGRNHRLSDAGGRHLELSVEVAPETADEVGITVCRSPDGEEQTAVSYVPSEEVLRVGHIPVLAYRRRWNRATLKTTCGSRKPHSRLPRENSSRSGCSSTGRSSKSSPTTDSALHSGSTRIEKIVQVCPYSPAAATHSSSRSTRGIWLRPISGERKPPPHSLEVEA